jgi:branched-chain amino acid transport system substrate-binding protein
VTETRLLTNRRTVLKGAAGIGAMTLASRFPTPAIAQNAPLKVGLLLPYSGTYAQLGEAITRAMELYVNQDAGSLGGREITFAKVDDESAPPRATELTTRLIQGENVDVLSGTVHSGVALAMAQVAAEAEVPTICPNAGADALTQGLCARTFFRSSFANSQVGYATGRAMIDEGLRRAVTFTWDYAAGAESTAGFRRAFEEGGGEVIEDLKIPFPDVEFQSALAQIASLRPEATYSFFAGGGALKYLQDYAAAGLKDTIPLWGPGFLTDGIEQAAGAAGEGVKTGLHYADGLDNPEDRAFREAFQAAYGVAPDVYAVQGWDAMQLLNVGLEAVGGDLSRKDEFLDAMAAASFASPRGPFRLSASHNPIQNFYLRELRGGRSQFVRVAVEQLEHETTGCQMA